MQSTTLSDSLGSSGGLVAAAHVGVCGVLGAVPEAVKALAHFSEHNIPEGQKIKSLPPPLLRTPGFSSFLH